MPIGERWDFIARMVSQAPEEAGVYALWRGDEVIYYGRAQGGAVSIRSRLVDHFSGRDGACTRQATHYSWEISLRPAAREAELLKQFQDKFRRVPLCNAQTA